MTDKKFKEIFLIIVSCVCRSLTDLRKSSGKGEKRILRARGGKNTTKMPIEPTNFGSYGLTDSKANQRDCMGQI